MQKKESKLALLLHGLYHENNPLVVRKMRESRLVKWVVEWKGISDKGEDYRNGVAASRSNAVQS